MEHDSMRFFEGEENEIVRADMMNLNTPLSEEELQGEIAQWMLQIVQVGEVFFGQHIYDYEDQGHFQFEQVSQTLQGIIAKQGQLIPEEKIELLNQVYKLYTYLPKVFDPSQQKEILRRLKTKYAALRDGTDEILSNAFLSLANSIVYETRYPWVASERVFEDQHRAAFFCMFHRETFRQTLASVLSYASLRVIEEEFLAYIEMLHMHSGGHIDEPTSDDLAKGTFTLRAQKASLFMALHRVFQDQLEALLLLEPFGSEEPITTITANNRPDVLYPNQYRDLPIDGLSVILHLPVDMKKSIHAVEGKHVSSEIIYNWTIYPGMSLAMHLAPQELASMAAGENIYDSMKDFLQYQLRSVDLPENLLKECRIHVVCDQRTAEAVFELPPEVGPSVVMEYANPHEPRSSIRVRVPKDSNALTGVKTLHDAVDRAFQDLGALQKIEHHTIATDFIERANATMLILDSQSVAMHFASNNLIEIGRFYPDAKRDRLPKDDDDDSYMVR